MEDKQKILDHLLPALRETRSLHDLVNLQYDLNTETVKVTFETVSFDVNVKFDSGIAMIKDVIRAVN